MLSLGPDQTCHFGMHNFQEIFLTLLLDLQIFIFNHWKISKYYALSEVKDGMQTLEPTR